MAKDKAEMPDAAEMIDPFMYRYRDRAMNYDRRWVAGEKLGDTLGYWATTPFNRTGVHAQELYDELKKEGIITWDEKAFLFTHAQGVAARKHYEARVLQGDKAEKPIKANAKSWGNKHAGFTGKSYEELKEEFPALYEPKTSTYVSKADKVKMLTTAVQKLSKESDEPITLQHLAEETGLNIETVKSIMDELKKGPSEQVSDEEPKETTAAPVFDFDTTSTTEDDEDEVLESSEVEEDEDDEEEDEETEEVEAEAVAAATTTEAAFDFSNIAIVDESKPAKEQEAELDMTIDLSDVDFVKARVPVDASKEKIHTDSESVTWKIDANTTGQAFLIEVQGIGEYWLTPGKHVLVNPETGLMKAIEVIVPKPKK